MAAWLINGSFENSVNPLDRGLAYGDGLFETIFIKDCRPEALSLHIKRLETGAKKLGFNVNASKWIESDVQLLLDHDQKADQSVLCHGLGVLKIIVTRGEGSRGYMPAKIPNPNRFLALFSYDNSLKIFCYQGIKAHFCQTTLSRNKLLFGIKHLNRLEQVLAHQERQQDETIKEGLMLNNSNQVISGTFTNVFFVKNNVLKTPNIIDCGIEGIMRSRVINYAKSLNWDVEIGSYDVHSIREADECFVCNSIIKIWPIIKLEETIFEIGKKTRALINWFVDN